MVNEIIVYLSNISQLLELRPFALTDVLPTHSCIAYSKLPNTFYVRKVSFIAKSAKVLNYNLSILYNNNIELIDIQSSFKHNGQTVKDIGELL